MATIVLAEDHPLLRKSLRKVLEEAPDLRVVGEAVDGLDAVRVVQALRPEVLITDLSMPGLNGFQVIERLTRECSQTRIVVVSISIETPYILEALRLGARGYVRKEDALAHLILAVHAVLAGQRYVSPPYHERIIGIDLTN